jgi:hypothetical protein
MKVEAWCGGAPEVFITLSATEAMGLQDLMSVVQSALVSKHPCCVFAAQVRDALTDALGAVDGPET